MSNIIEFPGRLPPELSSEAVAEAQGTFGRISAADVQRLATMHLALINARDAKELGAQARKIAEKLAHASKVWAMIEESFRKDWRV